MILITLPPALSTPLHKISEDDDDTAVVDLALGSCHIIVVLDSGKILGVGRCDEGQLGIGAEERPWIAAWAEMDLAHVQGRVEKVWAGGWESWVLVDEGCEGV